MSCWVVPAVAADLWGVSVEAVLESIRRGEVPSRQDCDFLLVDVAPESPRVPPPRPYQVAPLPPPTFAAMTAEDVDDEENEGEVEGGEPLHFRAGRAMAARRRLGPTGRAAA